MKGERLMRKKFELKWLHKPDTARANRLRTLGIAIRGGETNSLDAVGVMEINLLFPHRLA